MLPSDPTSSQARLEGVRSIRRAVELGIGAAGLWLLMSVLGPFIIAVDVVSFLPTGPLFVGAIVGAGACLLVPPLALFPLIWGSRQFALGVGRLRASTIAENPSGADRFGRDASRVVALAQVLGYACIPMLVLFGAVGASSGGSVLGFEIALLVAGAALVALAGVTEALVLLAVPSIGGMLATVTRRPPTQGSTNLPPLVRWTAWTAAVPGAVLIVGAATSWFSIYTVWIAFLGCLAPIGALATFLSVRGRLGVVLQELQAPTAPAGFSVGPPRLRLWDDGADRLEGEPARIVLIGSTQNSAAMGNRIARDRLGAAVSIALGLGVLSISILYLSKGIPPTVFLIGALLIVLGPALLLRVDAFRLGSEMLSFGQWGTLVATERGLSGQFFPSERYQQAPGGYWTLRGSVTRFPLMRLAEPNVLPWSLLAMLVYPADPSVPDGRQIGVWVRSSENSLSGLRIDPMFLQAQDPRVRAAYPMGYPGTVALPELVPLIWTAMRGGAQVYVSEDSLTSEGLRAADSVKASRTPFGPVVLGFKSRALPVPPSTAALTGWLVPPPIASGPSQARLPSHDAPRSTATS
jgi:hypothetical protein